MLKCPKCKSPEIIKTAVPLKNFVCAWFDENIYYEFNPSLGDVEIGLKQRILSPDKVMDLGKN